MPKSNLKVFISSTLDDLLEIRQEAISICQNLGLITLPTEYLGASDKDPTAVSLEAIAAADIYIGILGNRYGWVPQGASTSITEMEYARATELLIPRLIFMADNPSEFQHPSQTRAE